MVFETENFVVTIPLRTTPADRATLRTRFEAARSAYNALLGECMRRLRLMRESRAFRAARKLPKGKERSAAFKALNIKFGFREYDLYQFIRTLRAGVSFHPSESPADVGARTRGRTGHIGRHLDAHSVMALAKRVFRAVERCAFGFNGRPRFHRAGEMRSVEGINKESAISWDKDRVWWRGLELAAIVDPNDPVIAHGLKHPACLTRIVRMVIRGHEHYYAQLVCKGEPFKKPNRIIGSGTVGLDLGPSTIAISHTRTTKEETTQLPRIFCAELEDKHEKIAECQRQESRKRRLNNLENFHPDHRDKHGRKRKGMPIKGRRCWKTSHRQREIARARSDLQRREAAHRKNLHGQLVNHVLSLGNDIRLEALSYYGFQRAFGRSSKFRAPGMFVSRLKAAAAKVGATVTEFNPRPTLLSQTCICGQIRKKKLSERTHECACGVQANRDQLSAFLAQHVSNGRLDLRQARTAWQRVCKPLRAGSMPNNAQREGASALDHDGRNRRQSVSHADIANNPVSAADVVAGRKTQARATEKPGEGDNRANANIKRTDIAITANAQLKATHGGGTRKPPPNNGPQMELWEEG